MNIYQRVKPHLIKLWIILAFITGATLAQLTRNTDIIYASGWIMVIFCCLAGVALAISFIIVGGIAVYQTLIEGAGKIEARLSHEG